MRRRSPPPTRGPGGSNRLPSPFLSGRPTAKDPAGPDPARIGWRGGHGSVAAFHGQAAGPQRLGDEHAGARQVGQFAADTALEEPVGPLEVARADDDEAHVMLLGKA